MCAKGCDDLIEGKRLAGFAVYQACDVEVRRVKMGFGARLLATELLLGCGALADATIVAAPRILRTTRPFIREGLRRGFGLYEQARAAAAEFADDVEDLVAEARADQASNSPGAADPVATDLKKA